MDSLVVLFLIVLLLMTWILFIKNDNRRAMINKFPGPICYPIAGTTLPFLFMNKPEGFAYLRSLTKKYGTLYRTWIGGSPVINMADPQYVELILGNSTHISKGFTYTFVLPWLGDGLLTSKGAKWHRHRKLLTPAFHFKILESFVSVFVEKSKILVEILADKADGRNAFNIFPFITHCTLDIISETAMGMQVNAMSKRSNSYVEAVYGVCREISNRMTKGWLVNDFIYYNTNYGKRFRKYISTLHKTTNIIIDERIRQRQQKETNEGEEDKDQFERKKRLAFLDLLLDVSKDSTVLTKEQIREEVDTFMFEGHDTTTASICWTLFLLGLHHAIQERAYDEVSQILQNDKGLDLSDLNEMKYLEMVLKESLRLYPSVATIGRYTSEDLVIENYVIPKGTSVSVLIYDIHRNEKYFPEPDKFNPDRFLPDVSKNRHPYAYIPFSAGPRNCIGQRFALAEEKTIMSYILKNYKINSIQTTENVQPVSELILRPFKGLYVTLEKRS